MSKVKIVLNGSGVRQLLKSPEMKTICKECADRAIQNLGTGYTATAYTGKNRVNASVKADTPKARKEARKNNAIMKALRR